jgi:endonuclease/exonuclease/phosphatase family metal-dependent hydrolase
VNSDRKGFITSIPETSRRPWRLRIATYNIHKGRGWDRRVRPDRILEVLSQIDADIVALQEVACIEGKGRQRNQAQYVAEELGYFVEIGKTRRYRGGSCGNVVLSRFPFEQVWKYNISTRIHERRGCLRTDVRLPQGELLHLFNVHLGPFFFERRRQARNIFDRQIVNHEGLAGMKIVLGDFNEWTKGLASRLFGSHFQCAGTKPTLNGESSYPGPMPLLNLDHIYFDRSFKLEDLAIHRSRTALAASDHLPLVAELSVRDRDTSTVVASSQWLNIGNATAPAATRVGVAQVEPFSGKLH